MHPRIYTIYADHKSINTGLLSERRCRFFPVPLTNDLHRAAGGRQRCWAVPRRRQARGRAADGHRPGDHTLPRAWAYTTDQAMNIKLRSFPPPPVAMKGFSIFLYFFFRPKKSFISRVHIQQILRCLRHVNGPVKILPTCLYY